MLRTGPTVTTSKPACREQPAHRLGRVEVGVLDVDDRAAFSPSTRADQRSDVVVEREDHAAGAEDPHGNRGASRAGRACGRAPGRASRHRTSPARTAPRRMTSWTISGRDARGRPWRSHRRSARLRGPSASPGRAPARARTRCHSRRRARRCRESRMARYAIERGAVRRAEPLELVAVIEASSSRYSSASASASSTGSDRTSPHAGTAPSGSGAVGKAPGRETYGGERVRIELRRIQLVALRRGCADRAQGRLEAGCHVTSLTGARVAGRRACSIARQTVGGPVAAGGRVGRAVEHRLDDERRSALDLLVHVREIGPDDRQAQQLDAADEEDDDDHRGEALRRRASGRRAAPPPRPSEPSDETTTTTSARHGDQVERYVGERHDRPARPAEVLAQRVRGRAEHPLGPDVGDAELLEADPCAQAAHEPMLLRQRVHRVDDAAVDQAEVACIERDVHVGQTLEDPVEAAGRRSA